MKYHPLAVECITNSSVYSLINSVDFHPEENLLCATFSTRDLLIIYSISPQGRARVFQKITGIDTALDNPQHAVFSRDGKRIIVSNWHSEKFTIYSRLPDGSYSPAPAKVIEFPENFRGYKPHGSALDSTGGFMAVAFGASARRPRGIGVFRFDSTDNSLHPHGLLLDSCLPGIPKGICFSPDDSHLMVTFSDINCIKLYAFDHLNGAITEAMNHPHQGSDTGLGRPEDIKVSHSKNHVIVSNSGNDTIAFYKFDPASNRIVEQGPAFTLGREQRGFAFPHGLAVSADGRFLAVSQFGTLKTTVDDDIAFDHQTPTRQSKIWIFENSSCNRSLTSQRNGWWTPWLRQLRDRFESRS